MLLDVLKKNPVVPVAVFRNADDACRVAEILLEGSITVLEVTLRTDAAYDCISRVAERFPEIATGAGSVLSVESLQRARDHGAGFGVAPCIDPAVAGHAAEKGFPFMPGIATPSELSLALATARIIKFFPAAAMGGIDYLKAITAPFKTFDYHLVPTGGVNDGNYLQYLKEESVIACGMTYPVDAALLEKGDFGAVRERVSRIVAGLSDR
ncbi:MAG: bifunctional 4-hydroxy-2-oxoglutarate aldolase/2-dehydro-3-deoxy-phosphogluconate aldolase [Spirochaetes bacterium]|nr:bifunctional 4-hydroxy-2-oxoglutarate aldolase/2-dehydro-3-deoxy-phosphogluconate aldolase [Spirochaetota bacterium]